MVVYNTLSESVETRRPRQTLKVGFGLFFVILGILVLTQGPAFFDTVVDNQLVLSESSKTFGLWQNVSIPVYMEFYMFNWTNPEEFKIPGKKPILQELGPYVYREMRWKVIEEWHPENGTISFRTNRTWHFEPEMSQGSLDDVIFTINTVAASAEHSLKNIDFFTKMLVDSAILATDAKHYVQATVREMLFDGYQDPLLDLVSIVPKGILPVTIPMQRFGWLHTRNGSADSDGVVNMHTGSHDMSKFGEIARWNNKNHTGKFRSTCGDLSGSAGELFPPHLRNNKTISIFSPEICRSIPMDYEDEATVNGIPVSRYVIKEDLFAGQDTNPDNWCYCHSDEKSQCPPAGLLDLSKCKFGASAYLSAPHFHNADPILRSSVVGMNPDPSKHNSFIEIEPRLGMPLRGTAAFQINVLVEEHDGFSMFEGAPKIYFPTLWFKQVVKMDDSMNLIVKVIIYLPTVMTIAAYASILLGFILLILVFSTLFKQSPRKAKQTYFAVLPELQCV